MLLVLSSHETQSHCWMKWNMKHSLIALHACRIKISGSSELLTTAWYIVEGIPAWKSRCFRSSFCPVSQFSRSVVSHSLWPHRWQHTRPPCPSPTPEVYSDSCPLSLWCHPSHPLSSPSPPAFNLSQHQGLFKWVSSLHQVMVESSDKMWSTGEGNGKPLQFFLPWAPWTVWKGKKIVSVLLLTIIAWKSYGLLQLLVSQWVKWEVWKKRNVSLRAFLALRF